MKTSSIIPLNEIGVRKIVREEFEHAKPEWTREITESVSKNVGDKFDRVMTTLDKFVGEIQSYREEQTLNQLHHDRMDKRIKNLEHPVL